MVEDYPGSVATYDDVWLQYGYFLNQKITIALKGFAQF